MVKRVAAQFMAPSHNIMQVLLGKMRPTGASVFIRPREV